MRINKKLLKFLTYIYNYSNIFILLTAKLIKIIFNNKSVFLKFLNLEKQIRLVT